MKKRKLKIFFIGLSVPIFFLTLDLLNKNKQIDYIYNEVKNELSNIINLPNSDVLESDNVWIKSIVESSKSNTIKLFFTRNASLVFQQSLIVIQSILNDNFFSDKNNPFIDEIAFFIDENVVKNSDKFNYNRLIDKNNILFVSNLNDINKTKNQAYKTIPGDDFILETLKFYNKFTNMNIKFDLWIPDISLLEVWNSKSLAFLEILPYINKIYLLSDGNAQTYSFANQYDEYKVNNNLSDEEIKTSIDKLRSINVDYNERLDIYKKTNFFDFLVTDFFKIFHIDRYVDSPFYKTNLNKRYSSYILNYDYFDLSKKLNLNSPKIFIDDYEFFFKINNASLNEFISLGYENYDPKKKNIIWIGDSLIKKYSDVDKNRKEEIQSLFYGIVRKYSPNEYNYFFKHHPSYTENEQIELTNFIIGKTNDVKPIYFKNFPWELFLSWDKKQQENPNYSSFFSYKSNDGLIPKTQLIGMQYTTSVIPTTYNFCIRQYNMSSNNAWKSVTNLNFPIPGTFDIILRNPPSQYPYDEQVKINLEKIKSVYNPYLGLGKYENMLKSAKSVSEFLNNNLNQNYKIFSKNNYLLYFTPLIIVSTISIFIIPIFVFFIKKNKKR